MAAKDAREARLLAFRGKSGAPDEAAVLQPLERILASSDFDASPRSRAFIRFIVEETLAGRAEALTQSAIATRVFVRREDFDPTVDPIVRIQAGRLRRSLERYYLLAGVADPVRIELPRGTYMPVARWRAEAGTGAAGGRAEWAPADPEGWPSVVVWGFETDPPTGELGAAASRLKDQLCVELGHYGDVRVVYRSELDRLGKGPCEHGDFELSGRIAGPATAPRVTARLISCRNASQVWAEEYRWPAGAPDPSCDETARVIAGRVASEYGVVARLLWAERRDRPGAGLRPYDAILLSYRFFFNREPADFVPAWDALQRVVRERPECALAWVQLSRLCVSNCMLDVVPLDTRIEDAIGWAQRGVTLDPSSQRARAVLAAAFLAKGELAAGLAEAQKAYALNPDSVVYLEWIGYLTALTGDWERGTSLIRRAEARNPNQTAVPLVARGRITCAATSTRRPTWWRCA
jgi:adenylate cyclase